MPYQDYLSHNTNSIVKPQETYPIIRELLAPSKQTQQQASLDNLQSNIHSFLQHLFTVKVTHRFVRLYKLFLYTLPPLPASIKTNQKRFSQTNHTLVTKKNMRMHQLKVKLSHKLL